MLRECVNDRLPVGVSTWLLRGRMKEHMLVFIGERHTPLSESADGGCNEPETGNSTGDYSEAHGTSNVYIVFLRFKIRQALPGQDHR